MVTISLGTVKILRNLFGWLGGWGVPFQIFEIRSLLITFFYPLFLISTFGLDTTQFQKWSRSYAFHIASKNSCIFMIMKKLGGYPPPLKVILFWKNQVGTPYPWKWSYFEKIKWVPPHPWKWSYSEKIKWIPPTLESDPILKKSSGYPPSQK